MINLASAPFIYFYPQENQELPKDSCEQVADFCLWFIRDLSQEAFVHEGSHLFAVKAQTNAWILWAFLGYTVFLVMTLIGYVALYCSESHHQTYQKYDEFRFDEWSQRLCELVRDEAEQPDTVQEIYDFLEKGVAHFSIEKVQPYIKDMLSDSFGPTPALMRLFNAWGAYGSLEQIFLAAAEKPDNIKHLFRGCASDEALNRLLQFFLSHDRDGKMPDVLIQQLIAYATDLAVDAGIDAEISPELKNRCLQGLFYVHQRIGDTRIQAIIAEHPAAFDGYTFLDSPELRQNNATWKLLVTAFEGAQANKGLTLKDWQEEMTPEFMRLGLKNSFETIANTLKSDCTSVPFYQALITALTEPDFSAELTQIVKRPFSDEALQTIMQECFIQEVNTDKFTVFYGQVEDNMSQRIATWCASSLFFKELPKLEANNCKQMLAHILQQEQSAFIQSWFTQFLQDHKAKVIATRELIIEQCEDLPGLAEMVRNI